MHNLCEDERIRFGPFDTQGDADKLFLMLVCTELDHPMDDVTARHSQRAWISA